MSENELESSKTSKQRKSLFHSVVVLAWPAMIEQALQTIVQYADSAMVGALGVQATASVGLTTTVTWLTNSPLWALGTGVLACIAKAVGERDSQKTRSAALQAIWMAIIGGLALMLITETVAPFLPSWLNADREIRRDGYLYYAIVCAPMIFRALSVILGSALRASGDARTPMLVNLGMNIINIVLNLFMIFPTREVSVLGNQFTLFGFGWGVTGAAVATAISVVFSGSFMLLRVLQSPTISPKKLVRKSKRDLWDGKTMRECIRVGLPVALQNLGVFSGQVVFSAQVTALGQTALATHSLALTAEEAFYIPGYGMQAAASTLSGIALGERDEKKLNRTSRMVLAISVMLMTITGTILFLIPETMMSLFTSDADVIAAGGRILRIVACSEPLYGAMIIFEGIYHGVGQTKYPFAVALSTMWIVRIGGTLLCLRVFGLGLTAVWLCMVADNVSRALLLGIRFYTGRWKRSLGFSNSVEMN